MKNQEHQKQLRQAIAKQTGKNRQETKKHQNSSKNKGPYQQHKTWKKISSQADQ